MICDVHCHVNLYLTLDQIIKEALNAGVNKIIAVGMSYIGLERIIEISSHYDIIFPALGIHPEEVKMNKNIENQLETACDYIKKNADKIVAIGEIGLDHYFVKEKELYPLQEKIFKNMLELAQELALPVNLHTKGGEKHIFDLLPSYSISNVNIHWYSGPEKYLKEGIDRGYYFSITPAISYSHAVHKTVEMVDINHLLVESDGPVKYKGEIGTPAMTRQVINSISQIKNVPEEEIEEQIYQNTRQIFSKLF
ncbi:MAG: TatD family hydrolase [Promethearchaeota archaeon]